ncbi:MAG: BamA/TamA family outer membrane protein [Akkermansiaceae bacterium]|nr:BamA/TamA family outer membrane protein [Akkermansiaceae bacterium]
MVLRITILILLVTSALTPGARVEFVGLRSFTSETLLEAVAGRMDYIRKREATDSRADDAAYLVESYLRTHGLPDAVILGQRISDDKIRLTIEEGLSQFLGSIKVIGFDDVQAIQDQFQATFPETVKRRAFEAKFIEEGLERVRDLLHTDGYWEGIVTAVQETRQANGEIPFTLKIQKGPLFTLDTPNLESRVKPSAALKKMASEAKGETATAENIISLRRNITEDYRRQGYPDISLTMLKETKGKKLLLNFLITPGNKYLVRSFQTTGLNKTKPANIRDRFTKLIGENFDEELANQEIQKLLSTGAFSSVRLEKTEINDTELDLTLHLKEAKARGYSVALGYGSIEGYTLGLRYFDRNPWGSLSNLSAVAEITSLGGLGAISLSNPFFLDQDLRLANRAFLINRNFDNYDKLEGGIGSELTWKWGENYSSTVGLTMSQTSINTPIPKELAGSRNYMVSRLGLQQLFDRRNNSALPSDGWFARLNTSLGLSDGDNTIGFFEVESQISYYQTLSENSSYALGLRGGFISPASENQNLPIDLRKFLGGANTIRSFPELKMGSSFNGNALGGTEWWIANAEYMYNLAGPFKALVFIDAAGLDSEVELAAGLGVRINLPVGPIRLEYGRSLSQNSGEPGGAFHFAIGTTF